MSGSDATTFAAHQEPGDESREPNNRELLATVAAYGLPGSALGLPQAPLSDRRWERLLRAAASERLVGLLGAAVADEALPVTDAQLEELAARHQDAMKLTLRVERAAQHVVGTLAEAGVPTRMLKGLALGHLSYPEPEQRPTGDVDVLVPSARFDEAIAALTAAGARRVLPELRPGFDRRFTKAVTMTAADGHNVLDVHRTFVMGPFGLAIDLEELMSGGQHFTVGETVMTALGREERLLHAAYNVAVGERPPRTLALRDVAQLILVEGIDADRAVELARAWGGQAVLAEAIEEAWQRLQLHDRTSLTSWASSYRPTGLEQRRLAASRSRSYAPKARASLPLIPGWRDKVAFVTALALPRRGWLRSRGDHRRGWLSGGWTALREADT